MYWYSRGSDGFQYQRRRNISERARPLRDIYNFLANVIGGAPRATNYDQIYSIIYNEAQVSRYFLRFSVILASRYKARLS